MRSGLWCLLLCFQFAVWNVNAQELPDIVGILESNGIQSTEEGYEEMVNILSYLSVSPLNINTVHFDSLRLLFFLSDSQIDEILRFRKKQGGILHLNELLLIPGISRRDLENISPFVLLGKSSSKERRDVLKNRMKHEMFLKGKTSFPLQEGYRTYSPREFEKQKDYDRKADNRFHGPPFGLMFRYKWTMGDYLQVGLTLENDAGEGYLTRNQRMGFDFCSVHARLTTRHWVRTVLVGDYRLQWGQGLIAWGGFSSGKSDIAVGNEKSAKGIAPYTSTDENNYLRGIALNLMPLPQLAVDVFFSGKKTDGNLLRSDTLSEEDLLSVSLYESGYHRNNPECRKKHTLTEWTTGIAVRWNTSRFKLGTQVLYYDFNPSLIPGDRIYQRYNDTGENRFLASVDYKTVIYGIYFFGETAFSDNGACATLNGVRYSRSWFSGCLLYRRYDKRYVSHYSAGFGEYSNTSNEEGIYYGMDIVPVKNLKFNLYYDWFRFFAPRYGAVHPGHGQEISGNINYRHARFEHHLRLKYERRPENSGGKASTDRKKSEYRYQFHYIPSKHWEFRTRLSLSHYNKNKVKEKGYMIYQDVIHSRPKTKLKIQYRLACFDTDSYQSRIYAYENNVLYAYSFPFFSGKGWRTYLNLNWKPVSKLTLYLKSGFVIYPDQESIGSGLMKVGDNKLYDITFQLRVTI